MFLRVKVLLKDGSDLEVVVNLENTRTSCKFLTALRAGSHGVNFTCADFHEELWSDLLKR